MRDANRKAMFAKVRKPDDLKTKIIKHGSGYEVYDGREKVQSTTSLKYAFDTAKDMEKEHLKRRTYWAKSKFKR